jgi:hypothetical protein
MVIRIPLVGPLLAMLLLAAFSPACFAQATGINFTLQYAHAIVEGDRGIVPSATIGLGFHRDFQRRIGMGVEVNYAKREGSDLKAFEAIYSARYFTGDNDGTSFYLGSFLGVQRISGQGERTSTAEVQNVSRVQFPVGLRIGLRGGLDGYFGELFTHVGYALGNGTLLTTSSGTMDSAPLYLGLGISFLGFGWED